MAAAPSPTIERRAHVRFPAHELSGLRSARLKYGQPIEVIDLSAGGVCFATAATLTPEATIVLEFSGPARNVLVPSRVLRVRTLRDAAYNVRTQGACAFKRPIGLRDLVTAQYTARESRPDAGAGVVWHAVIAKCRDGRVINGFTADFNPARPSLHVSPQRSPANAQRLELAELDAIFFLREDDDSGPADRVREQPTPYGRRVSLALPGGEQLTGATLNYSRLSSGVFVYPLDADFGVARVFVTPSGTRSLRLL